MSKIIAREVPPECINFSFYFDNDGFTNAGGENCAVYIVPTNRRRNSGFNMEEYEQIEDKAEAIIDGFYDVSNKWTDGYKTYKEVMEYNDIPYTSHKCHLLKKWAENADTSDTECIAEFLTITTGEKWNVKAFHGYSQGDYCEVVYCEKRYSEEAITEIGKMWLGCGTEFAIDGCYGFFVIDEIRWAEDERLIKYLADMYGCDTKDLEVYLYKGERRVSEYELLKVV